MRKILIVEDDLNIRETLIEILELSGFKVYSAKNGGEGYEQLVLHQPDLVLCDINMPVLNGYELLTKINQDIERKPIFIYLTAKVEEKDINIGLNLGASEFLIKPFDYLHVIDRINFYLN